MSPPLDLDGPGDLTFEPWSDTIGGGIVQRFADVARHHAAHLAIADERLHLTYKELSAASRALAARIATECPAGAIGILLPHSAEFWVAILACLGAGRTYVALDLHHPPARNADILRDAGLAAIIVPPEDVAGCAAVGDSLPKLRWQLQQIEQNVPDWPAPEPPAEDWPSLVLYTSGSTGRPKGIVNNERAILQRVGQYVDACHLHAGDRFLTLSSPCTIAGTREGMTALLIGATLYVADTQRAGFSDVLQLIRHSGVTVFNSVPSMLRALAGAPGDPAAALRSLRIVRIGGEVVFWSDLKLFRRVLPTECKIQIGYSSTEATGTQWFVPEQVTPTGAFVPVGYLLPGNAGSIIDETGRTLPPNHVGELVLRSRSIALGVWQNGGCQPGSISRAPDYPDERILHTGDLAQIDETGLCTIVGRKDRQVKINGVRVEPAEVEAAIRTMPQTRDAAVIARRSGRTMALVAFIVPECPDARISIRQLRGELRTILPAAMRPTRLHVLEAIPRLPSGKLDRSALEELDTVRRPGHGPEIGDPAQAQTAQAVRRSWRAVLGRRALDVDASFEASGGDSLKLLEFVFWLETLLGRPLPLDLFDERMHVREVIAAIEESAKNSADSLTDSRPMVFLFPGLDGDEPRLAQFRAELKGQVRFAVIEYPGWRDMVREGGGFDLLVDHAVSQVIAAQPSETLVLAGYSFGGDVAYGAALRLLALGRSVQWLAILDTDLERVFHDAAAHEHWRALPDVRQLLAETGSDRVNTCAGFLLAKLARDVVGLERMLGYHGRLWRRLLPRRTYFAFERRVRTILRLRSRWTWSRGAQHDRLAVPTTLFRATVGASDAAADLGWSARCSVLRTVPVEGDHRSMMEAPHRSVLVSEFAAALGAVADASAA